MGNSGKTDNADKRAALPAGPQPGDRNKTFFDDPIVDQLLRSVVSLTMELSITRERLAALEAVLHDQVNIDLAAIDEFVPSPEEDQDRGAARAKLIEEILGPIVEKLSQS